jgi:predicted transcriptional regulator
MGEGGDSAPATPKPRRKRPPGKRRRRRSQAPRGQRREQLLAAIEAKPGARLSELAGEIGIAPGQVSALLAKARAEKLIVMQGAGYALKK